MRIGIDIVVHIICVLLYCMLFSSSCVFIFSFGDVIFTQPNEFSKEEAAAIIIQAHFRGYLARKLFVQLLYEKFLKVGHNI